jgi:UDP-glucose 4-epimerase
VKRHLITGGAGFIGVNLARELLARGDSVVSLDNYCRGASSNFIAIHGNPQLQDIRVDCADLEAFMTVAQSIHNEVPVDVVWHMAANSDIPAGIADPSIDLRDTFMTTFNTLLVMRALKIPLLNFASSSAIYGDLGDVEINEDMGPLSPISNYGAMKLGSEAQIRAAVEAYLPRANVFRFPNVVGVPATHGVILDFVRKLQTSPNQLNVLGDGTQQKLYLHVTNLIEAMLHISDHAHGNYNVFNIGPPDTGATVESIAVAVRDRVAPKARIAFGEGNRGWVGDVPKFRYDTKKLQQLGWTPSLTSLEAVARAVDEIARQEKS